jgi:hypothetical protein
MILKIQMGLPQPPPKFSQKLHPAIVTRRPTFRQASFCPLPGRLRLSAQSATIHSASTLNSQPSTFP